MFTMLRLRVGRGEAAGAVSGAVDSYSARLSHRGSPLVRSRSSSAVASHSDA